MYTDWDVHENKTCQNLAWSSPSGAGRVIRKLVTFANAVLTNNSFKYIFLSSIYVDCSGQIIHCLKISGNKNNLRTIWDWNRQKRKNNPAWAERYWFLLKKARIKPDSEAYFRTFTEYIDTRKSGSKIYFSLVYRTTFKSNIYTGVLQRIVNVIGFNTRL